MCSGSSENFARVSAVVTVNEREPASGGYIGNNIEYISRSELAYIEHLPDGAVSGLIMYHYHRAQCIGTVVLFPDEVQRSYRSRREILLCARSGLPKLRPFIEVKVEARQAVTFYSRTNGALFLGSGVAGLTMLTR